MSEIKPVVSILMGSRSDLPTMENCFNQLKEFGIPFEAHALSAHRTPNEVIKLAEGAKDRGIKVIIAAAGGAAHLGGVIASSTTLPVIGVPIQTSALGGMDSLLSTVQMPGGIPVATVAIGKAGAKNAAILAAQMLALSDEAMAEKMVAFKASMAEKVIKDAGDKIDEADKNDINQKIATLRETISGGNVDAIKLGTEDLQKAVYAVSEKLYKNQAGQANPADNTTPPAGDATGADGQVYDADFKDVDSDKKDGENR